jgi:hypothetical protein
MPRFTGQNKKRIDPRYFLEETTNRELSPEEERIKELLADYDEALAAEADAWPNPYNPNDIMHIMTMNTRSNIEDQLDKLPGGKEALKAHMKVHKDRSRAKSMMKDDDRYKQHEGNKTKQKLEERPKPRLKDKPGLEDKEQGKNSSFRHFRWEEERNEAYEKWEEVVAYAYTVEYLHDQGRVHDDLAEKAKEELDLMQQNLIDAFGYRWADLAAWRKKIENDRHWDIQDDEGAYLPKRYDEWPEAKLEPIDRGYDPDLQKSSRIDWEKQGGSRGYQHLEERAPERIRTHPSGEEYKWTGSERDLPDEYMSRYVTSPMANPLSGHEKNIEDFLEDYEDAVKRGDVAKEKEIEKILLRTGHISDRYYGDLQAIKRKVGDAQAHPQWSGDHDLGG